jgi:hypothetical protein
MEIRGEAMDDTIEDEGQQQRIVYVLHPNCNVEGIYWDCRGHASHGRLRYWLSSIHNMIPLSIIFIFIPLPLNK